MSAMSEEYTVVLSQFIALCWRQVLDLESVNTDNYTAGQLRVHYEVLCGLYLTIAEHQREVINSLCGERGNSSLSCSTAVTGSTSPPIDP